MKEGKYFLKTLDFFWLVFLPPSKNIASHTCDFFQLRVSDCNNILYALHDTSEKQALNHNTVLRLYYDLILQSFKIEVNKKIWTQKGNKNILLEF